MYDVILIGGGLNYAAAIVLSKAGKKVALIEKDLNHLGGTCLHNGCIPSKNLLHRAGSVIESKEEVFTKSAHLNLQKLQDKIKSRIQKSTKAVTAQCKAAGVKLIEGEAFVTDDGVEVNGEIIKSEYTIIGTGSYPRIPEGIKYDSKKIITSDEALNFKHVPKEISIYGTGAIGLEMASLFAALGSRVNLIYRHKNISKKFPPSITQKLETQLKTLGINLIPEFSIQKAFVKDNKVIIQSGDKILSSEYLLVAAGRVPDTNVVKTDKIRVSKGIETDEFFQTSMPNVYAIGDCNGKLLLAHAARAQALNVADQILGKKEKLNLDNIPKFIYTLPLSYANIGERSEKTAAFPLSYLGISGSGFGDENGEVILYADEEGFLCGADIFAPNAEELIGIIATALEAELDINTFKKVTFPHPTYSEAIDRALRKFK
ncbi:glucose inhibited division protein A [Nautilia profundicola AmH]|uniref:Glucose inhibited division protein A n=1 Tax=Nautilia profundicola (strain ATCC BAA-1463 / DSM 18972 / AmH) TaxID=598659 RepID=B9L964_NAUPA|nr:NAD(P)/FAD-dependent oxidoreductase [Nautilia profundicola]ACM93226.1 glucose inhibited division protein A [Nautilia profundicola AmH]